MKKFLVKAFFTILLMVALTVFGNAYEPVISGQVAVQQLNDSYDSSANMTIYQSFKNWSWVGYILIPVLIFFKDIKKLFGGRK